MVDWATLKIHKKDKQELDKISIEYGLSIYDIIHRFIEENRLTPSGVSVGVSHIKQEIDIKHEYILKPVMRMVRNKNFIGGE